MSATLAQGAGMMLVAMATSSILSAWLYAPFRRAARQLSPASRSLGTLCYALIAPTVVMITAFIQFTPWIAQMPILPHCHDGVCGQHSPLISAQSAGGAALIALAGMLITICLIGATRALLLAQRRLRTLFALSNPSTGQDLLIVDTNHLFAWCCGLLRPRIVLSRGLIDTLTEEELQVVLAHEAAHAERLDNLRNLSAQWSTVLWPTAARKRIREDLADDNERACDAAVLSRVRDQGVLQRVVKLVTRPHASTERLHWTSDSVADAASPAPTGFALVSLCVLQLVVASAASHALIEVAAQIGGVG